MNSENAQLIVEDSENDARLDAVALK